MSIATMTIMHLQIATLYHAVLCGWSRRTGQGYIKFLLSRHTLESFFSHFAFIAVRIRIRDIAFSVSGWLFLISHPDCVRVSVGPATSLHQRNVIGVRDARGGGGAQCPPPHFSGSLRLHSGNLPESTHICPNSVIILKISY